MKPPHLLPHMLYCPAGAVEAVLGLGTVSEMPAHCSTALVILAPSAEAHVFYSSENHIPKSGNEQG